MFIVFSDLPKFNKQVAMVDGAFDPLHAGHISYFQSAQELGLPLLVNIAPDDYTLRKHPIFLPAAQRAVVIDALRSVSYVHVSSVSTAEVLKKLAPRYYIKGKDWEGKLPELEVGICEELGIDIVFLDTVSDSSSDILKRYCSKVK